LKTGENEGVKQKPGVRIQKPEYKAETTSTDFLFFRLLTPEFWILLSYC
jgi:hypothetical protein